MEGRLARMLTGGHPNALGRTEEVVVIVLADRARLDELFDCLRVEDPVVRTRAGDALEEVCRRRPEWLAHEAERVLRDVGTIDQPSVRWHVAQILGHLRTAAGARRLPG
jgi:hypothetical protein